MQVMIETAGKDKEENLERFWTGLPMQRASKALITKQLRNLLCGLFVHAKIIYFSDVKISVDFISALFCDVKKPAKKKTADLNEDDELSFKNQSVFDTITKLSFLSCEFEDGVMEWITKKFKAIDTLVFKTCQLKNFPRSSYLPVAFLSQPFNPKKCKFYESLRFLVVESYETFLSVNLEKYKTEEEKKFIEKFITLDQELLSKGIPINDGDQTLYLHCPRNDIDSYSLELAPSLSIIPEHVIVICIKSEGNILQRAFRSHWRNSSKDLQMFGVVDSSFPLYPILGFDESEVKLVGLKQASEIMDIFYMGFNFWNSSLYSQAQYIAIVIIYYYEDDQIVNFLRSKGMNVDLEYFDEYYTDNISRIVVIRTILQIATYLNVLTKSLTKYFEKNGANISKLIDKGDFINIAVKSYTDYQIEFILYLAEIKILSERFKMLKRKEKDSNILEPALKKQKQ